jgi:hypothetical protein
MRRRHAIALMATIVGGAIAAGSGLTAWATWAVSATPVQRMVQAGRMPTVEKLTVRLDGGKLTFSWHRARFASGDAVGGYRVLATAGAFTGTVCETTASELSCTYSPAEKNATTYVVRALAGSGWVGPASNAVTYVPGKEIGSKKAGVAAAPPVTGVAPGGSAPQATPEPGPASSSAAPRATAPEKAPETTTETTATAETTAETAATAEPAASGE